MRMTVGATSSQKIARDTLDNGVRMLKSAPHLLHRTLLGRAALWKKTANRPPARKASKLKEPLSSTAGL